MSRYLWLGLASALSVAACDGASAPDPAAVNRAPPVNPVTASRPPAAPPRPAVAPAANRSVFTTLDIKQCRLVESNPEEGSYSRHDCPGVGGFRFELIESDLRQSLVILHPGGARSQLPLSSAAGGGGFSNLGTTFEWRGADPTKPRTLIVRFNVNEDPEPTVAARSYLLVIGLAAPACVVAVVPPGPEQSAEARRIADLPELPACRER